MSESWIAFYVILGIFSIGYGIFLIALHVRLWRVLGYIRMACTVWLSQSEYQKKRAIEMFKQGNHNIYNIATQLKVRQTEVAGWIENNPEIQAERAEKKKHAIEMHKEGKEIYLIANKIGVTYDEVKRWIEIDQADRAEEPPDEQ